LPANSGAITGTKSHQHSAPSGDGGFLSQNITGVTGTANGSLLYFDGSSVAQDLPAGNLNDTLTMGATLPQWSASTPAASTFELLGYTELGANAATISVSFGSESGDDMTALQCFYNSALTTSTTDLGCQFSTGAAFVTSQYYTSAFNSMALASINFNNQAYWLINRNPNNRRQSGNFTLNCTNSAWSSGATEDPTIMGNGVETNPSNFTFGGIQNTSISSFDGVRINTSAGNFYAGSYLAVYKINNS